MENLIPMENYFSNGDDEELKFEEIMTIEDNPIKDRHVSNDRKKKNVITKLFDSISLKKQYTISPIL